MPPAVHSLKLVLTFAAATFGAVFLAVQMHQGSHAEPGVRAATPVFASASIEPPLPTLRDASPPPIVIRRAIPVGKDLPKAEESEPQVPTAIPVSVAQPAPSTTPATAMTIASSASSELPVADAKALTVGKLSLRDSYEPFVDSLTDVMRKEAPKAVPLPMVYQAVLMNDNEWLGQLLKDGFAVNDTTPFGETALCAAVKARNQDAVEMLLLHGADPNLPGRDGQAPLALACLMRSERMIPALLNAGADADTTYQGPVPDDLLKGLPCTELCESLKTDRGVTVLMAVAARGDTEGAIALLAHGANPDRPTKRYYRYPINYAAEEHYLFIMRLLLGRPADSEPDILITVDLSEQKAYLSKAGEVVDKTSVSTGREGFATPQGRYVVTDKHSSWTSTIYHVEMPWFMRLNCSAIGLHAGYVTGEPASHGCIRLPYEKARKWFGMVSAGDEVQIVR